MDWELMTELARRRPEWSFVFVGGDPQEAPGVLRAHPNVHFQGSLPYPAALGAISCFDVGTIPALIGRFSRGNSFLKLLDYFAHGVPVGARPLPDTSQLAEASTGLLHLAEGADDWEASLEAAIQEPKDAPLREARRSHVAQRSVERGSSG